jgi:RNA-binding protein PNO1
MEEVKGEAQVGKERMEINFAQTLDQVRKKADVYHVSVPPHRMAPLKQNWELIVKTIVEHMKLQIRMNTKKKAVEIRVPTHIL